MIEFLIVIILSSFYLICVLPLGFILRNLSEINISLQKSLILLIALSFFLASSCSYFGIIYGCLAIIANIFFLVQMFAYLSNLFILPILGTMEGEELSKEKRKKIYIFESAIFVGLVCTCFVEEQLFIKISIFISIFILLEQLFFLFKSYFINSKIVLTHKKYHTTYNRYNVFSKDENIVTIVLDCFGSSVFQEYLKVCPKTKEILKDFEFYPTTSSYGAGTMLAIPAFFTSQYPKDNTERQIGPAYYRFLEESFSNTNHFLKKLKINNYRNEIYPYMPQFTYISPKYIDNVEETKKSILNIHFLINLILLLLLPYFLKKRFYKYIMNFGLNRDNQQKGFRQYDDLDFYNEFKNGLNLSSSEKCFKFYHLAGLHFPFLLNENLEKTDVSSSGKDALLITVKAYIKMIAFFIDQLKKSEIYDNTSIIIMGDHGLGYDISPLEHDEVRENSLLLFKGLNQHFDKLYINNEIYPDVSDFYNLVLFSSHISENKWNVSQEKQKFNKSLIDTKRKERNLLREKNILHKVNNIPTSYHNIEVAYIREKDFMGTKLRLSLTLASEISVKLKDFYLVLSGKDNEFFVGGKQKIFEQTFFVDEGMNYCSILVSADLSPCPDGMYNIQVVTTRTDKKLTKWLVRLLLIKKKDIISMEVTQ